MANRLFRKALSAPGLLRKVCACFDEVEDPVPGRKFSLSDCLMSGLAVFGLKYPSLLRFDRDARTDETVRAKPADHTALFEWVESTERMNSSSQKRNRTTLVL